MPFKDLQSVENRLTQDKAPLTDAEIQELYPWMQYLTVGAARRLDAELALRNIEAVRKFDKSSSRIGKWSLALTVALFFLTVAAVWIAIASYRDTKRSATEQQRTLDTSREALQTATTLLQQSVQTAKDQLDLAQQQQAQALQRPNVVGILLYPQSPSILLVNHSKTKTATDVMAEARFWDVSKPQSDGFQLAAGPPVKCDYINADTTCGPYKVDFQGIVPVDGDELFGYVMVHCPDCLKFRVYWADIMLGKEGVFTEGKGDSYDWYHMNPTNAKQIVSSFRKRKDLVRIPRQWPPAPRKSTSQ